jgi:hypothetical protein
MEGLPGMKVLIDYHHSDLFEGHHLLFQDRFGWDVFRPIGMDWFHEEYWQFEKKWHETPLSTSGSVTIRPIRGGSTRC